MRSLKWRGTCAVVTRALSVVRFLFLSSFLQCLALSSLSLSFSARFVVLPMREQVKPSAVRFGSPNSPDLDR